MVEVARRRSPSLDSSEESNRVQGRTDRNTKKRKIDELEDTTKEPESETLESSSHVAQMAFKCNFCHREFTTPQALGGHQNAHKMDRALMKQKREVEKMHPHFPLYYRGGNYHPYNNYYNAMSSRSMYGMPQLNWGNMPYPNRVYNLPRLRQRIQLMRGFNQTIMPLANAPSRQKDPQELDLSLKL